MNLLEELREHEHDYPTLIHGPLCGKAADEIERLRAALKRIADGQDKDGLPANDGTLAKLVRAEHIARDAIANEQ